MLQDAIIEINYLQVTLVKIESNYNKIVNPNKIENLNKVLFKFCGIHLQC